MKIKIIIIWFVWLLLSCRYVNEKVVTTECFLNHVGTYRFDIKETIAGSGGLGIYTKDSSLLKKFLITFESDSTFHMNMMVDFFSDTIGRWASGNCGFENPGTVRYYSSPSVEQIGVRHKGTLHFIKLSPYTKEFGVITLCFKRVSD